MKAAEQKGRGISEIGAVYVQRMGSISFVNSRDFPRKEKNWNEVGWLQKYGMDLSITSKLDPKIYP